MMPGGKGAPGKGAQAAAPTTAMGSIMNRIWSPSPAAPALHRRL